MLLISDTSRASADAQEDDKSLGGSEIVQSKTLLSHIIILFASLVPCRTVLMLCGAST